MFYVACMNCSMTKACNSCTDVYICMHAWIFVTATLFLMSNATSTFSCISISFHLYNFFWLERMGSAPSRVFILSYSICMHGMYIYIYTIHRLLLHAANLSVPSSGLFSYIFRCIPKFTFILFFLHAFRFPFKLIACAWILCSFANLSDSVLTPCSYMFSLCCSFPAAVAARSRHPRQRTRGRSGSVQ